MLNAIQRARVKHRLHDEADLALFAQQACKWGERFTEHPDLMAALAMTQDGETRYCDALMQIDDSRMQRIDAELSV